MSLSKNVFAVVQNNLYSLSLHPYNFASREFLRFGGKIYSCIYYANNRLHYAALELGLKQRPLYALAFFVNLLPMVQRRLRLYFWPDVIFLLEGSYVFWEQLGFSHKAIGYFPVSFFSAVFFNHHLDKFSCVLRSLGFRYNFFYRRINDALGDVDTHLTSFDFSFVQSYRPVTHILLFKYYRIPYFLMAKHFNIGVYADHYLSNSFFYDNFAFYKQRWPFDQFFGLYGYCFRNFFSKAIFFKYFSQVYLFYKKFLFAFFYNYLQFFYFYKLFWKFCLFLGVVCHSLFFDFFFSFGKLFLSNSFVLWRLYMERFLQLFQGDFKWAFGQLFSSVIASFFLNSFSRVLFFGKFVWEKVIFFSNVSFVHFLSLGSSNRSHFIFMSRLAGSLCLSSRLLSIIDTKFFVWSWKLRHFLKSTGGYKLRSAKQKVLYSSLMEQQGLFRKIFRLGSLHRQFRLGYWHWFWQYCLSSSIFKPLQSVYGSKVFYLRRLSFGRYKHRLVSNYRRRFVVKPTASRRFYALRTLFGSAAFSWRQYLFMTAGTFSFAFFYRNSMSLFNRHYRKLWSYYFKKDAVSIVHRALWATGGSVGVRQQEDVSIVKSKGEPTGFYKFRNSGLVFLFFICGFLRTFSSKEQKLLQGFFLFKGFFFKKKFFKPLRAALQSLSRAFAFKLRFLCLSEGVTNSKPKPWKFVQNGLQLRLKSYVFSFFFQSVSGDSLVFPKAGSFSGFFSSLVFFDLLGSVLALLPVFFSACLCKFWRAYSILKLRFGVKIFSLSANGLRVNGSLGFTRFPFLKLVLRRCYRVFMYSFFSKKFFSSFFFKGKAGGFYIKRRFVVKAPKIFLWKRYQNILFFNKQLKAFKVAKQFQSAVASVRYSRSIIRLWFLTKGALRRASLWRSFPNVFRLVDRVGLLKLKGSKSESKRYWISNFYGSSYATFGFLSAAQFWRLGYNFLELTTRSTRNFWARRSPLRFLLLRVGFTFTAFFEGLRCHLLAIGGEHMADFGARGARGFFNKAGFFNQQVPLLFSARGLLKARGKRFSYHRFFSFRSRRLLRRFTRSSAVKSPLIKAAVKAEVPRGSSMLKVKSYASTS